MVRATWALGLGADAQAAFALRRQVFQGEPAPDALDAISAHVLVYEGDAPVATGRLFPAQDGWHIGRLCVLEEYRGRRYADMALRMLCARALDSAPSADLVLAVPPAAAAFCAAFGFKPDGTAGENTHRIRMRVNGADFSFNRPCERTL